MGLSSGQTTKAWPVLGWQLLPGTPVRLPWIEMASVDSLFLNMGHSHSHLLRPSSALWAWGASGGEKGQTLGATQCLAVWLWGWEAPLWNMIDWMLISSKVKYKGYTCMLCCNPWPMIGIGLRKKHGQVGWIMSASPFKLSNWSELQSGLDNWLDSHPSTHFTNLGKP